MSNFASNIVSNFLISFGVIIGASIFAGLGAIINDRPPLKTMFDIASSTKIWAIAVALNGTFASFEVLELGILKGEVKSLVKQISYIITAIIGANLGYAVIKLIERCGELWSK